MFAFPIIYEIVLQDHLHVHLLTFDVLRNNDEYATAKCLSRNIDSVGLSVYICHNLSVHIVPEFGIKRSSSRSCYHVQPRLEDSS